MKDTDLNGQIEKVEESKNYEVFAPSVPKCGKWGRACGHTFTNKKFFHGKCFAICTGTV